MVDYYTPLYPDKLYHIFSRATGSEKLFLNEDNYRYFLNRFKHHISPIAEVWSWCLLPNHFHFLIEIKSLETIQVYFQNIKPNSLFLEETTSDFLMERFSNLLNSYVKAFNKQHHRKGSLFMDYMRRVEIMEDIQLGATVFYIHKNPVHHGYCKHIEDWKWSSYNSILSDNITLIKRSELLNWFNDKEEFIKYHSQDIYIKTASVIDL